MDRKRGKIETVLVIGGGRMGCGIASSFARAGLPVRLSSRRPDQIRAALPGVVVEHGLPADPPDLMIEAITEEADAKRALFLDAARRYPPPTVLASNTSGLDLEVLAGGIEAPERFCGLHYLYPPDAFPFVELVATGATAPATLDRVEGILERAGKQALRLSRPVIGFLINRLQHAMIHEAYHLIETGVVRVEDVDLVARRLLGPRLCLTGLLEQKDLSGLETHARSQAAIVPHLQHGAEPSPLPGRLCRAGRTGVDAGAGFYDWRDCDLDAYRGEIAERLQHLFAIIETDLPSRPRPLAPPAAKVEDG